MTSALAGNAQNASGGAWAATGGAEAGLSFSRGRGGRPTSCVRIRKQGYRRHARGRRGCAGDGLQPDIEE